jgi:hypothetical protein
MNLATRVEAWMQDRIPGPRAHSLAARVIALVVEDPRTTPQGLRASLQQQVEFLRLPRLRPGSPPERLMDDLIAAFGLQDRLVGAEEAIRLPRGPSKEAWRRLAARFPWPDSPPNPPAVTVRHFTQPALLELLDQAFDELQPRCVVEVGAWAGGTTQWLLQRWPGQLVTIDTWLGSAEHQSGSAWYTARNDHPTLLAGLFEHFLARCWADRDRLVPLRTTSLDGFWQIAIAGVQPDLIVLDAAHDEQSVRSELQLAHRLFPRARLVIDDYNRGERWLRGLVRAVDQFALEQQLTIVEAHGQACMLVR